MSTVAATFRTVSTQLSAYWELTKPGITLMVLISMMIGYFMGSSLMMFFDWTIFLHVSVGTFMIAAGTSAYNQYLERDLDKLMVRTEKRPLPAQRVSKVNSYVFSVSLIIGGLFYLISHVNIVAAGVSALTSILYLGFYTPLKRISFINVFVGAIPGALPPVGGWAAATGNILHPAVWILFGIVFFWQIAHVIAIGWLCKDDYSKAGFKMLPKDEYSGRMNQFILMASVFILVPIALSLSYLEITTWVFGIIGAIAGLYYTYKGWIFLKDKSEDTSRGLLFASLFYLPIVWLALFLDRLIGGWVL